MMPQKYSAREYYKELFSNDRIKAEAFDKLAELYYMNNFSSTPKSEVDLLMFSIYLDCHLSSKEDPSGGDCYILSKLLGLTKNRVASLKERKEIKYPSEFDWKDSFRNVMENAEYIDNKIHLFIRDHRLYVELQQLIEEMGSYSETKLTKQLIVVTPPVFVDLMLEAAGEAERESMQEELQKILANNHIDADSYVKKQLTFKEALKEQSGDVVKEVLMAVVGRIPGLNTVTAIAVEHLFNKIHHAMRI